MVACAHCGGRMTPLAPEAVEKARRRDVFVDLDGRVHDHSLDTATILWTCPKKHDTITVKTILCPWCGGHIPYGTPTE
jgi:hypothetical protein